MARWLVVTVVLGGCNLALNAVRPSSDRAGPATGDTGGGPTPPVGATLFLSEVVAGPNGVKFVELYNRTGDRQELDGYELRRYANDNDFPQEILPLDGFAVRDERAFVMSGEAGVFVDEYGVEPDLADTARVVGDGNDTYVLFYLGNGPEEIVDIYGEIGVDGSGSEWDYALLSARRVENVVSGRSDFDDAEWEFYPWDDANPGDR